MRIQAKAILLISAPLVFQIVVAGVIAWNFAQANKKLDEELLGKHVIAAVDRMERLREDSICNAFLYSLLKDPNYLALVDRRAAEVHKVLDDLTKLTARDPRYSYEISRLKSAVEESLVYDKVMIGSDLNERPPWTMRLEQEMDKWIEAGPISSYLRELKAREQFDQTLERSLSQTQTLAYFFSSLNLVLCFFLVSFAARHLVSRFSRVAEHVESFVLRGTVSAVVDGSDEIAALDRNIQSSARRMIDISRFKQEVVAMVSHDLRTPLTSISTYLSLLAADNLESAKSKGEALKSSNKRAIDTAIDHCKKLSLLVQNVLDSERAETSSQGITIQSYETVELIDQLITEGILSESAIAIDESTMEAVVSIDLDLTTRALTNLVENIKQMGCDADQVQLTIKSTDAEVVLELQSPLAKRSEQDAENMASDEFRKLNLKLVRSFLKPQKIQLQQLSCAFEVRLPRATAQAGPDAQAVEHDQSALSRVVQTRKRTKFPVGMKLALGIFIPALVSSISLIVLATQLDTVKNSIASEFASRQVIHKAIEMTLEIRKVMMLAIFENYSSKTEIGQRRKESELKLLRLFDEMTKVESSPSSMVKSDYMKKEGERLTKLIAWERSLAKLEPHEMTSVLMDGDLAGYFRGPNGLYSEIGRKVVDQQEALKTSYQSAITNFSLVSVALGVVATLLAVFLISTNFTLRLAKLNSRATRLFGHGTTELVEPQVVAEGNDELAFLEAYVEECGKQLQAREVEKKQILTILRDAIGFRLKSTSEVLQAIAYHDENPSGPASKNANWIKSELSRLSTMVNDLLDVDALSSGELNLIEEPVKATDLVAEALTVVEAFSASRGVQLSSTISDADCLINVDYQRTIQVLVNLLTNAIKFTPAGGAVSVVCNCGVDQAKIAISDQGPGIPPEAQDRLFKPFSQLDNTEATARNSGSGLGLYIAKSFVEAQGGKIGFHPNQGVGTTFWIQVKTPVGLW